ncbi:transglutaminase-like cysteine peptidase [Oryzibacter oryziterrae]|uniref:transglutaminase-like cysteine peptidase n=1 Tax=Oryzibacter oryziterrae TaxID=2766474 RepID=UPI001F325C74|nr:transglutaminase-like cysteine peptidase [Oryzibacter oryziterrae]
MFKIATLKNITLFSLIVMGSSEAFATQKMMEIKGTTPPPIGYIQFCGVHPDDCRPYVRPNQIVRLDTNSWTQLSQVNSGVNAAVMPATDMQIYGVIERWEYPKVAGDCEDYVLEKRRELVNVGWPESALLITVVRDEAGDGHAVLTVRTDRGDVVLDNKTDQILVWADTPYSYLKRQSPANPNSWDLIQDARTSLVGSVN